MFKALPFGGARGDWPDADVFAAQALIPAPDTEGGFTPVHLAAEAGHEAVLQALLATLTVTMADLREDNRPRVLRSIFGPRFAELEITCFASPRACLPKMGRKGLGLGRVRDWHHCLAAHGNYGILLRCCLTGYASILSHEMVSHTLWLRVGCVLFLALQIIRG